MKGKFITPSTPPQQGRYALSNLLASTANGFRSHSSVLREAREHPCISDNKKALASLSCWLEPAPQAPNKKCCLWLGSSWRPCLNGRQPIKAVQCMITLTLACLPSSRVGPGVEITAARWLHILATVRVAWLGWPLTKCCVMIACSDCCWAG